MEGLSTLLQSFADLLTPVVRFIIWIFPIKAKWLHEGELGVRLTFGNRSHPVSPGVHIYTSCQEIQTIQALGGYVDLDEQGMKGNNGLVVLNGAVQYQVIDPVKALLHTEEIELLVKGICMNVLRENVADLEDSEKLTHELGKKANIALRPNGVKVDRFMITDLRPHDVAMAVDAFVEATDKVIKWRKDERCCETSERND